jgi:hypothetical protein
MTWRKMCSVSQLTAASLVGVCGLASPVVVASIGAAVATGVVGGAGRVAHAQVSTGGPITVEPYGVVVTTSDVPIRCGDSTLYYPISIAKLGDALIVDGETTGWLRVKYPKGLRVFVKADEVTEVGVGSAGSQIRLAKPSKLLSPNHNAGVRGSFFQSMQSELPAGSTLTLREAIKDDSGKVTHYSVDAPEQARGFISREAVRRMTPDESTALFAQSASANTAVAPVVTEQVMPTMPAMPATTTVTAPVTQAVNEVATQVTQAVAPVVPVVLPANVPPAVVPPVTTTTQATVPEVTGNVVTVTTVPVTAPVQPTLPPVVVSETSTQASTTSQQVASGGSVSGSGITISNPADGTTTTTQGSQTIVTPTGGTQTTTTQTQVTTTPTTTTEYRVVETRTVEQGQTVLVPTVQMPVQREVVEVQSTMTGTRQGDVITLQLPASNQGAVDTSVARLLPSTVAPTMLTIPQTLTETRTMTTVATGQSQTQSQTQNQTQQVQVVQAPPPPPPPPAPTPVVVQQPVVIAPPPPPPPPAPVAPVVVPQPVVTTTTQTIVEPITIPIQVQDAPVEIPLTVAVGEKGETTTIMVPAGDKGAGGAGIPGQQVTTRTLTTTTRTGGIDLTTRQGGLDGLAALYNRVRNQPLETAELEQAIAEFERFKAGLGNSASDQRLAAYLQNFIDTMKLRQQLRDQQRLNVERVSSTRLEQTDIGRRILELERQRVYTIIGRLVRSTVYDGNRAPVLYRVMSPEPGSARTLGYLLPDEKFELSGKLEQVVGIIGELRPDEALRTNLIIPTRVDAVSLAPLRAVPQGQPAGTP